LRPSMVLVFPAISHSRQCPIFDATTDIGYESYQPLTVTLKFLFLLTFPRSRSWKSTLDKDGIIQESVATMSEEEKSRLFMKRMIKAIF
jgi:hypothetical protein